MDIIFISLAAFVGGIVSAVLGWLDSHDLFEMRKFVASILRALVAAAAYAIAYTVVGSTISILDFIIAFVAGAGFDSSLNRIAGAIKFK